MANCRALTAAETRAREVANPLTLHEPEAGPQDTMAELANRLERIETRLGQLVDLVERGQTVKEFYSTQEVARLLGREMFTVREWARLGRIHAVKRRCGRGKTHDWAISHEELERIRNHGLLPPGGCRDNQ